MVKQWSASSCGFKVTCSRSQNSDCSPFLFLFCFSPPSAFLVGAFLVKRAQLLQWLVFFRQTTILTLIGPLFLQKLLKLLRPKAKSGQRKLSARGPSFHFLLFQGNLQNRTCLKGEPYESHHFLHMAFKSDYKNFFLLTLCPENICPPFNFFSAL